MALTGQQEIAAGLVAADKLTDPQICAEIGIKSRITLQTWRHKPEFAARVSEIRAEMRATARTYGIAVVEERLMAQNERWLAMKQVIEERAEDETMRGAGHATGLLVRKYKMIGSGESAYMVEEYEVDTGLLKEMRELEKHAAIEMGQWEEKQQVTSISTIAISSIRAVEPAARPTDNDAA